MMKRLTFLFVFLMLFNVSCSNKSGTSGFKSISPAEAAKLIETRKDLLLIDVRSPEELKEGYIDGSELVPFMDLAQGKRGLPKDRPILLICAIGGRSYTLGKLLEQNGWPEIYNLSGGISAWKANGLPLKY